MENKNVLIVDENLTKELADEIMNKYLENLIKFGTGYLYICSTPKGNNDGK